MDNREGIRNSFLNCLSKVNQFSDLERNSQLDIVDVLMNYFDYVSNFQEITFVNNVKRATDGSYELVLGGFSQDSSISVQMTLNFYHKDNEDSVKVATYKGIVENGQNRWTMDRLTFYKDRITGNLDSFVNDSKKEIVSTLFKGDIVIPNKNNKKELQWLDGEEVANIFSIGLAEHLKQTNRPLMDEHLGINL